MRTKLTLVFLAVLLLPAVTLVWLGVRLAGQDRALWAQRDVERRQAAADAMVRSLERSLAEAQGWQAGGAIPEGALRMIVSPAGMRTEPPGRVLWQAGRAALPEADASAFADAERQEFQGAAGQALTRYRELARSSVAGVRAGALLRLARVERRGGRIDEALAAYGMLAAIRGVAIDGEPADFVARRAICGVLEESGKRVEMAREASSLEADFLAGRWALDRAAWELAAGQLAQWTGHEMRVPAERKALSEAADWVWEQAGRLDPSGRRVLGSETPATVVWHTAGTETIAVAMAPSLVRAWANTAAAGVDAPVSLVAETGQVLMGGRPDPANAVRRTAPETGLPWTVVVSPGDASRVSQQFAARRRLLAMGLGAIVLLLAGGSYLLWRVVERELAVARLQTDFVAAVSHEFRTPLTSLRHVTELLEEDDDVPAERRKAFYGALGRSTERLSRLVESLLDFGRMELGRKPYDLRPADAGAIAAQVVSDFEKEAGARGFTIHLDRDGGGALPVRGDAAALTHALWNLLDNAIKYSPEEREVWVAVRGEAGGVSITVRDRGLGIPRGEREEIFRKFVRGEKAKELGIKGTGLGLAMVSHIVSAHGGRVELESEEGSGSTFRVVLPGRRGL